MSTFDWRANADERGHNTTFYSCRTLYEAQTIARKFRASGLLAVAYETPLPDGSFAVEVKQKKA